MAVAGPTDVLVGVSGCILRTSRSSTSASTFLQRAAALELRMTSASVRRLLPSNDSVLSLSVEFAQLRGEIRRSKFTLDQQEDPHHTLREV